MDISEIKSGILGLDSDGLDVITNAINYRRKEVNQEIKNQFNVGDNVRFIGQGDEIRGTITKINRKYIVVREESNPISQWNVSPSLLTKIEDRKDLVGDSPLTTLEAYYEK